MFAAAVYSSGIFHVIISALYLDLSLMYDVLVYCVNIYNNYFDYFNFIF